MADSAVTPPGDDEFTFESTADKKYPMCPEGVHKVIVEKAVFSMKDNYQQTAKVPTITLWLVTREASYEDEQTKEKRNYRLFKTLKVSDHKKANMADFFDKVCGIPVPLKEVKKPDGTVAKRIYLGPRSVEKSDNDEEEVQYKQFENLEFSVLVEHKIPEGGTEKKDRISAVVACSPEQKQYNAKLFTTA